MGPTLVYHTPTENLPHLLNRLSPKTSPLPTPGWTSPRNEHSQPLPRLASPHPDKPSKADTTTDIEWDPSLETYLNRVERLAQLGEDLPRTVPDGFPTTIRSARVWDGADFASNESAYVYTLTTEDLEEVDQALKTFIGMISVPFL